MNKEIIDLFKVIGSSFLIALFCMGIGFLAYAFALGAYYFSYLPFLGIETHAFPTVDIWLGGAIASLFTIVLSNYILSYSRKREKKTKEK